MTIRGTSAKSPENHFTGLQSSIEQAVGRVDSSCDRVQRMVEQLHGPMVVGVAGQTISAQAPKPRAIVVASEDLHTALSRLEELLQQLEG